MAFQARLLAALSDPSLSLRDVADRLCLPMDQLALVLARPDLAHEIDSLQELSAVRVRLTASSLLPNAAHAIQRVLADFQSGVSDCSRETALRAVRILLRLANFAPGPVQSRPPSFKPLRSPSQSPDSGRSHHAQEHQAQAASKHTSVLPNPSPSEPREKGPIPATEQTCARPETQPAPANSQPRHETTDSESDGDEQTLSPLEAIERAAKLIRDGAFTDDQLGELFRIAAAESGEDPDAAGFDFASARDLAAQLESVADVLRDPQAAQFAGAPP